MWVAWLNLENAFGTQPSPEEAAMGLLRRALSYTDQKKMYMAALGEILNCIARAAHRKALERGLAGFLLACAD